MLKSNRIVHNQAWFFILSFFLFNGVCISQSQQTEEDNAGKSFKPVHFERVHSVIIDADADAVFNLLGPRGARLINSQTVDFLYGNEEDLDRALFRIYSNRNNNWNYYCVGKYDRVGRIYRTTILMPEVEYWLNEYSVEAIDSGKSKFTVRWRIAGYHKNSNEAIQGFIDHDLKQKLFIQSVEKIGQTLESFIKNQSK